MCGPPIVMTKFVNQVLLADIPRILIESEGPPEGSAPQCGLVWEILPASWGKRLSLVLVLAATATIFETYTQVSRRLCMSTLPRSALPRYDTGCPVLVDTIDKDTY
jgi:hypothetical protein